eukprot:TRINITY_DN7979_c2_g1_i10.p2 TRINITY_DN7979_c2_g1~~TRINITY_DN7979_c2_g1_i10.p2  ORF type:complete len:108 (-),score=2.56 TRINITY_DN7979_c2_g1_i10:612-935(-)
MREGLDQSFLIFSQVMSPAGLRTSFCEIYRQNLTFLVCGDLRGPQLILLTIFLIFVIVWRLVGGVGPTTHYGTDSSVILFIEKGEGFEKSPRQVSCLHFKSSEPIFY